MVEEVLVESKMEHVVSQEVNVCNDFELGTSTGRDEMDVVVNITKKDCSAAGETKQISDNTELLRFSVTINDRDVADLAKSKRCAETQVQGAMGCPGVPISSLPEPFGENQSFEESDCVKSSIKEALNGEKPVPDEVLNGSAMEPRVENHAIGVLDSGDLEHCCVTIEVKEAANDFMSNNFASDKAEDTSNDDVYSEVLNPNPSPKHLTSSLTSSSQPLDVLASDPGGFGDITSSCSQTSSADGNSCKEKHVQNYTSESVSTSCVAIEIPKNVSTAGIRKITFKFSKREEDYDSKISCPGKPMANNEFQDHSDIHSCLSAGQPSTCADHHKWSWNTHETINRNEKRFRA